MTATTKQAPATAKGAHGRHQGPAKRSGGGHASGPKVESTLACRGLVEIILFGKTHWVTPEQYVKNSAKYADLLDVEKRLLLGEVDALAAAHADFMSPPWLVAVGNAATKAWETMLRPGARAYWDEHVLGAAGPDEARFKATREALDEVQPPLESTDERAILSVGQQLCSHRLAIAKLREDMAKQREEVLTETKKSVEYAELVEDSSVQVLMMVAEKTSFNPVQELGYKIAIAVLEGGVKTGAAAMAGVHWQTDFLDTLRNRLPGILVDWFMRALRPYLGSDASGFIKKHLATPFVRAFFDALCGLYQLYVNASEPLTRDDLWAFAKIQLTSALASFFAHILHQKPESPVPKKAAAAVVTAFVQASAAESSALSQLTSGDPPLTWTEAILVRSPLFIARVAQQLVLAIIGQLKTYPVPSTAADPSPEPPKRVTRVRQRLASTMRQFRRTTLRPRLEPLAGAALEEARQQTNLTPEVIEALRAFSLENNSIQAVRMVNPFFALLHGLPGMRPKSEAVKAKTAREGRPHQGKSVKPETAEEIRELWNEKQLRIMRDAEILCREDGLVFHPDMLVDAAPAAQKAQMTEVAALLKRVGAREGVMVELGSAAAKEAIASEIARLPADKRVATKALLDQALRSSQVGYYGDLDYMEQVDASTGKRVPLGPNENGRAGAAAKENLKRLAVALSPHLSEDADLVFALPQHGAAVEVIDPKTGQLKFSRVGDVVVFLPDGTFQILKYPPAPEGMSSTKAVHEQDKILRRQFDEIVARYTADAYLSESERHADARTATPAVVPSPPRAPRLAAKTAGDLPRSGLMSSEMPSDRGTPATRLDLHVSLVSRSLTVIHPDNATFFEGLIDPVDLRELASAFARASIVAGVDAERQELVVMTDDADGVADALKRLAGAQVALQRAGVGLRRWWEIVAPICLASSDGIAGVLPDLPGDLATASDARTGDLSSAHPPRGHVLKRFRAIRGVLSYAAPGDWAPAARLDEVWERTSNRAFDIRATTLAGRSVALFRIPPARHHPGDGAAVVAPQWIFNHDLRSAAGQASALIALGYLEPTGRADPAAVLSAVRRFQAATVKMRVDGVVGPVTRGALRAALADIEGDGIVEREALGAPQ